MVIGVTNKEWLNENAERSYPLTEAATKADISGSITIPDSFILGLYFPAHAGLDIDPTLFYIRQLTIDSLGYTVSLAFDDGSSDPPRVATATIPKSLHSEGDVYALPGINDFADSVGKIQIGELSEIDSLPAGEFNFDLEATNIEADSIRPQIRGVSALIVDNAGDISERITGDIIFQAGNNTRITPIIVAGEDPIIRWDAIDGEGTLEDCVCEGDEDLSPCIRTINGIPPTPSGNFIFIGNDCLEVRPGPNRLQFADVCSQPCCGCEELEAVTADLSLLQDGARTVEGFNERLAAQIDLFGNTILGARLNDSGCFTC
jgi:hypothetical protein